MARWSCLVLSLLVLAVWKVECDDGALELGSNDFEPTIRKHSLMLVNFHAQWCKFSRMLDPVFDIVAKELPRLYPGEESVRLGKVDCEREVEVARKYSINKYPTIKIFKNGKVQKKEYRGQRTKEAFLEFIRKQMESPLKEIKNLDDLPDMMDSQKQTIIGYFADRNSEDFKQFDKVASMLRDDCQWFVGLGDVASSQRPGGGFQIVYKPPNVEHGEKIFTSSLKTHDLFYAWAHDKCVPLVRTITFENAEELTEEGIPFLILFHRPDDTESPRKFTEVVQKHLFKQKEGITFLTADGVQFAHPLHHMGKQVRDLPVLAIDSFKHMFVYPSDRDMFDPDQLFGFIQDLHSGKLHREFHHGPDPATRAPPNRLPQDDNNDRTPPPSQKGSTIPESQFAKLAPSDLRYSFRDEL